MKQKITSSSTLTQRLSGLVVASGVIGASLLTVAWVLPNFVFLTLIYCVGGYFNGRFNVQMALAISQTVPLSHQGRVWGGMKTLVNSAILLGMLSSGFITDTSARLALSLAGLGPLVLLLAFLLSRVSRRVRCAD